MDGWMPTARFWELSMRLTTPPARRPGFVDMADKDYHLATGSRCINAGEELPVDILPDHALQQQYIRHQSYTTRPRDNLIDMGAFESDN